MTDDGHKPKYVDPQREREKESSLTREREQQQRDKEGRAKNPNYDRDRSDARVDREHPFARPEPCDPRGNS